MRYSIQSRRIILLEVFDSYLLVFWLMVRFSKKSMHQIKRFMKKAMPLNPDFFRSIDYDEILVS